MVRHDRSLVTQQSLNHFMVMKTLLISTLLISLNAGAQNKPAPPAKPAPVNPAIALAKAKFESVKAAAAQGDAATLHELGDLYYAGKGIARNYAEAYKAYLAAAEKGHVISESTVAWMCRNGQGVARDYKKSMEWYTKAAEKGHVESQLGLAELYYNQVGLPARDYSAAYKWYLIADRLGSKVARAFLPRMQQTVLKEPKVTAAQKASAEKAADDWLAAYAKK
jgi:TPR repeat protein